MRNRNPRNPAFNAAGTLQLANPDSRQLKRIAAGAIQCYSYVLKLR